MTKHPRKLWSYWKHVSPGNNHLTLWQIVKIFPNNTFPKADDIQIKLLYSANPMTTSMKRGSSRYYKSYTIASEDRWEPILKQDVPLLVLGEI